MSSNHGAPLGARSSRVLGALLTLVLAGVTACGGRVGRSNEGPVQTGGSVTPAGSGGSGGQAAGGGAAGAASSPRPPTCNEETCACSNRVDDDGDGRIDGMDGDCTHSFDDDESSFYLGYPSHENSYSDCFFDLNAGSQDDGCRYDADCFTGALPPDDPNCQASTACIEFCERLTPNGCDCFGCCRIATADGPIDVLLKAECSMGNLADENACPRCRKSEECGNPCGSCELCRGADAVHPSCAERDCDEGALCDATTPCPPDSYCHFGCCVLDVWALAPPLP